MGLMNDVAVPILTGFVFGYALNSGKVSIPYTIVSQMEMQNFTMMRMFLTASGVATLCMSVLHNLGYYKREPKPAKALGFGLMYGYGANVVGGFLLGSGMYLAGACPGTIWAQMGALHTINQLYVFLGGLCGTIAYGYLHTYFKRNIEGYHVEKPVPFAKEPRKVDALGVVYSAAVIGLVTLLNSVLPWQGELSQVVSTPGKFFGDSFWDPIKNVGWDPLIAGVVVGALQIPAILSHGNSFGASSGWLYLSNKILVNFDENLNDNAPYICAASTSVVSKWQAWTAVGGIIGGFASQMLSSPVNPTYAIVNMSPLRSFLGGFIMLYGARLGGGCTSGHGLSGIATGSFGSFVSVGSMFLGGMLTSLVVNPSALLSLIK